MARLFRRSGRWGIDYTDHRGQRVRRLVATDKSVAQAALGLAVTAVEKMRNGLVTADPREAKRPIEEHLADYLAELHRRGRDEMYRYNVEKRIRMAIDKVPVSTLADFTPRAVAVYLRELKRGERLLTPKTKNQHLDTIKAFLNWCVEERRLEANPLLQLSREADKRDKSRRSLAEWECRALFACVPADRQLAYAVLLYSGLRRSEASAITWGDIHLSSLSPHVDLRASITKSGQRETVPLYHRVASMLEEQRQGHDDSARVFPDGMPDMKTFRQDLATAGIQEKPDGPKVVIHGFRHTLASLLAAHGVSDAMRTRLLRHRPRGITDVIYTDAASLPLHDAMQKLPDLLPTHVRDDESESLSATGTDEPGARFVPFERHNETPRDIHDGHGVPSVRTQPVHGTRISTSWHNSRQTTKTPRLGLEPRT